MLTKGESVSNLGNGSIKVIEDGLKGQVTKATGYSLLLIMHVPLAQSFKAEVERISERLVYAIQGVPLGHENLVSL